MIISKALIKHGYTNFTLEILEYSNKDQVIDREQYYLNSLLPVYNILKTAGSSLGSKHSEETKAKLIAAWTEERKASISALCIRVKSIPWKQNSKFLPVERRNELVNLLEHLKKL